jgi:hypothetical protein
LFENLPRLGSILLFAGFPSLAIKPEITVPYENFYKNTHPFWWSFSFFSKKLKNSKKFSHFLGLFAPQKKNSRSRLASPGCYA